ncbi:hypothetical protein H3N56_01990 [Cetobacterium sp. 2A]|uniref:hypothetical protein n=1 Tax=Cetobacterium sp. 2A TaxID=2754723 RepID=UPI00163BAEE7|nr:hypothetical protein [Cetobacterium sp. 2A]MBC2855264.1 hypothetical protein [Cetobacterium sp. 2A]
MIDKYAREAGVRNLEKAIKKIMRKVTLKIAEGNTEKIKITDKNLEEYLGAPVFCYRRTVSKRNSRSNLRSGLDFYGEELHYT